MSERVFTGSESYAACQVPGKHKIHHMSSEPEVPLAGGWVNQVVRIGETVHRSVGPWTPAVHAVLRHLEAADFDAAPRVLGFDDRGREVLTYIEGTVYEEPWAPQLREDAGLIALTRLLRRYHDAAADFAPPVGASWRAGAVPLQPGEVVRHGDFGPWNIVWLSGEPVGVIDWDFAEPGPPLLELAYLAWNAVPLRGEERLAAVGFDSRPDLRRRLRLVAGTYGAFSPEQIVDAVFEIAQSDINRTRAWGAEGKEPWSRFLTFGNPELFEAELDWLHEERHRLT